MLQAASGPPVIHVFADFYIRLEVIEARIADIFSGSKRLYG